MNNVEKVKKIKEIVKKHGKKVSGIEDYFMLIRKGYTLYLTNKNVLRVSVENEIGMYLFSEIEELDVEIFNVNKILKDLNENKYNDILEEV